MPTSRAAIAIRPKYPCDASVSLTSYNVEFSPVAHTKHRGAERQIPQYLPQNLTSDRDPLAANERMGRMRAHAEAMKSDPNIFKGKKTADSFGQYVEQAKIMKALLGDTRQVRDVHDRGEHQPYSYSRLGPEEDNRPDSYDYDDSWYEPRTRGYSPGNVRSLSPPPQKTSQWMSQLSAVDSTCSFAEQSVRQSKGQPALETRYSTIQLGKEWSNFRGQRYKRNVERKKAREEVERFRQEMDAETEVTKLSINKFEKRLKAMAEPGRSSKKRQDDESSDDEM
ncbi:hypothetical protein TeGR_g8260 [Tetraparma gracilis]|uniref:Uncharacterized protein n=1 Tax=Tetraparma gracilis TaxID=2962635 RepID=A0ABQ6N4L6_9STRA|nr:hypothetical protein TeGR_g8260 [Tetraparma gracilis]